MNRRLWLIGAVVSLLIGAAIAVPMVADDSTPVAGRSPTTTSPQLVAGEPAQKLYEKCLSYAPVTAARKHFCIESTNRVERVLERQPKSFSEPSKGRIPAPRLLYGGGRPVDDPQFVSDVSWATTSEGEEVRVYVGGYPDPAGGPPNVPAVLVYSSAGKSQILRAPTAPNRLLYLVRLSGHDMLLSSSETTAGELTQGRSPRVDVVFDTATRTFNSP